MEPLEESTTEISKLKIWFNSSKLSLNLNKSNLILFRNNKINTQINIQIDRVIIERVKEIQFLGRTSDEKLSWKPHIKNIHSKVLRNIAILNKAKQFLDHNSLWILYCSLVSPYLSYCAEVWGNNYKNTIHSLFIFQKRAIRIIQKAGYQDHTNTLLLQSEILKFADLVDFQTAQILFKVQNNQLTP